MNSEQRQVTLTLANVGQWTAETADALYVALDGDLEFGTRDGVGIVEVPMDASELWQRLPKVIDAIGRVLPNAEVIRVDISPLNRTIAA